MWMSNKVWRSHAKGCIYRARDGARLEPYLGHWLCTYTIVVNRCMQKTCPFYEQELSPPMTAAEEREQQRRKVADAPD